MELKTLGLVVSGITTALVISVVIWYFFIRKVDCEVSAWGACDPITGKKTRIITINKEGSGKSCPILEDTCPVNCEVSAWGSCNNGKTTRSILTTSKNGGIACPTTLEDKCCPNMFGVEGIPGQVVTRECGLGPLYKGNLINTCTNGIWSVVNTCVSSGVTDLIDITGSWKYNYAGNDWGIVSIVFDIANKKGSISGPGIPADINPSLKEIIYIPDKGYSIGGNQPAAFKDKTYTYLDGGNYSFTKTYTARDFVQLTSTGTDIGGPISKTLQGCIEACDLDDKCIGFSREKSSGSDTVSPCYLKQSYPAPVKANYKWHTFTKPGKSYPF